MGIIQFWTRGCNSRSGFHGQLNKRVRLTQNDKVINAYNWPPILVTWRAVWRWPCPFFREMHHQGLRHLWIASILDHRLSYKTGISDSFFLSDWESFEICSSWARRTLPALSVHHLRCVARGRWRSKGFGWLRNSTPQTLSTLCNEYFLHFGGIHW